MKKLVVLLMLHLLVSVTIGQGLSTDNLLSLATLSKKKIKGFLSKKGYVITGSEQNYDTIFTKYNYHLPAAGWNNKDSGQRTLVRGDVNESALISYTTHSKAEFLSLLEQFRQAGFYCNESTDSIAFKPLLFQHNETTIQTSISAINSLPDYTLQVYKKSFPAPKDIYYADDLLNFSSHEQLVYYFGKSNVKSDIYYFSENEIARCSVLFLNTRRQVVFIWQDELNKCKIAHLLFGGQQKLESAFDNNTFIAENSWVFKSGIRPGMSLMELRRLNGSNFNFYGGNAAFSGAVIGNKEGKLDFRKENVILSCMNCNDYNFSSSTLISADEALADSRILFVLSVALNAEINKEPQL